MIVDKIENANAYADLSEQLTIALQILLDTNFDKKENGRYDIDGDNIYYLVQRYSTEPAENRRLEAHRKYIDIQFLAAGTEIMAYCPLENLEIETPYNSEKDIIFYKKSDKISRITLTPGLFAVLYPQDVHMPKCQLDTPSDVLKVVVKVKI